MRSNRGQYKQQTNMRSLSSSNKEENIDTKFGCWHCPLSKLSVVFIFWIESSIDSLVSGAVLCDVATKKCCLCKMSTRVWMGPFSECQTMVSAGALKSIESTAVTLATTQQIKRWYDSFLEHNNERRQRSSAFPPNLKCNFKNALNLKCNSGVSQAPIVW